MRDDSSGPMSLPTVATLATSQVRIIFYFRISPNFKDFHPISLTFTGFSLFSQVFQDFLRTILPYFLVAQIAGGAADAYCQHGKADIFRKWRVVEE